MARVLRFGGPTSALIIDTNEQTVTFNSFSTGRFKHGCQTGGRAYYELAILKPGAVSKCFLKVSKCSVSKCSFRSKAARHQDEPHRCSLSPKEALEAVGSEPLSWLLLVVQDGVDARGRSSDRRDAVE